MRDVHGDPLPESAGFAALRDGTPSNDASIEAARSHYQTIFSRLAAGGYPRQSLQLAWDYTTASQQTVIGPIAAMRQRVFGSTTGKAGSAPANAITYTIQSVTPSTYVSGMQIVEGTFTPPNYLQLDDTIAFDPDGTPILVSLLPPQSYPFTMLVPPSAGTASASLVLYGHGLFSDGRHDLTSSGSYQELAQANNAVFVATDWIGLSKSDELAVFGTVATDFNNIGYVTDRLLQSLVNNLSLIELSLGALSQDPQARLSTAQPLVDPSKVYYLGVSLGGVEGSALASVARNVTRAALGVPGASWSNILARSFAYGPFVAIQSVVYPDPLLRQELLSLVQTRFDPADPINLATLFSRNPLPDSPASRSLLGIESIDDCLVQNVTTKMLMRAFGVSEVSPDIAPIAGVPTITTPTAQSAFSQYELQTAVAKYLPPYSNVPPAEDNGAHEGLASQPVPLQEVQTFLSTGQIVQACDGRPCILP